MTLLQFLLLYALPALICAASFVVAARADGYLKLSRLGTMTVIALMPVGNIIFCAWLAGLGLVLLGALSDWDRVIWTRKKKPRQ